MMSGVGRAVPQGLLHEMGMMFNNRGTRCTMFLVIVVKFV